MLILPFQYLKILSDRHANISIPASDNSNNLIPKVNANCSIIMFFFDYALNLYLIDMLIFLSQHHFLLIY